MQLGAWLVANSPLPGLTPQSRYHYDLEVVERIHYFEMFVQGQLSDGIAAMPIQV